MTDHVPIHPNQIPDLVQRIQQLELEVQRKNEIISQKCDNEAYLMRRVTHLQLIVDAYEATDAGS